MPERKDFDASGTQSVDHAWAVRYGVKVTIDERVGKVLMKKLRTTAKARQGKIVRKIKYVGGQVAEEDDETSSSNGSSPNSAVRSCAYSSG